MEGLIIGRNFAFQNGLGSPNKNSPKHYENSLKQLKNASTNSPWAYPGGLVIRRIVNVASEMWGAYFQEGLLFISSFLGGVGLIIRILQEFQS